MTIKFPAVYVQDAGALYTVGSRAAVFGKSAYIIIDPLDDGKLTRIISESLAQAGVSAITKVFNTSPNVTELIRLASEAANHDVVIGIGSGKVMDAAKATAYYAEKPIIICPTVASSDAPCTSIAVVTDNRTRSTKYLNLRSCPEVVIVDTALVASAPLRLTVAGMADALSTYYEAQHFLAKTSGDSYKSMLLDSVLELCRNNIFTYGQAAVNDIKSDDLTDAVEAVIEANILLSGIGFDNTGLSAAHALEKAFSLTKSKALHGEKVAVGLTIQLMLEGKTDELTKVVKLFSGVGLPLTLAELGIDINNKSLMADLVKFASGLKIMGNMPEKVTESQLQNAIVDAESFCRKVLNSADMGENMQR